MAKATVPLLVLAFLAAAAATEAAPAPLPKGKAKAGGPPTAAELRKTLLGRGIHVWRVERGRAGEWLVCFRLCVTDDGRRKDVLVWKRIEASGPDEWGVLHELVKSDVTSAELWGGAALARRSGD